MFVDKIDEHHQEIKKLLRELSEDVYCEDDIPPNTLWIALKLGHLSAYLQMHLKFEDDYLYPCLLNSSQDNARATADKLVKKMGELAAKFDLYIHKYIGNPNAIKEKAVDFATESKQIIAQIFERIEAEEKELYLLLSENPSCNTKL
ncbi:hypothetical protein DCCM_3973 [Desulfocucumis palustris]|uniref:Hemerythrin-like domain-containing protein n=1 Tax=Desulfocucumis palustris TaxID=1898651 RepID=A0A2L2XGL2_9FIRM|nr:hemerythrin domain-containing protein [Desulfocucumis palustris]GBF34853.1 hypothetical protein DCCM_3973 [Desulfocucumis palustris]